MTIKIKKRNGHETEYDGSKIVMAITKAMYDVYKKVNKDLAHEIESEIYDILINGVKEATIEEISDAVEELLMKHGEFKVAKSYILYRRERDEERTKETYGILSKEFLSKYKHIDPPFSAIGGFVYARTYAKWIPEKGRREYWHESVKRMVEFSCGIVPTTRKEAEALYDNIFNLRQNLSGRMAFVGGSETSKDHPLSLFNCAFLDVKEFNDFGQMFYLLMLGAGMGARITKDVVSQLPKVRQNVEVIHKHRKAVDKSDRQEYTTTNHFSDEVIEIVVGDSREAWRDALDMYFKIISDISFRNVKTVVINYNHIREKNSRLKRFGGKSGGYEPLMNMFEKISNLFYNGNDTKIKLSPLQCGDIATIIGENVVAGNIRRTAIILICDPDDHEVINAKANLYTQKDGKWVVNNDIIHRQMSNNTTVYYSKPSRELFHGNFKKMKLSGEPGQYFMEEALRRNPNARGLNPLTL